MGDEGKPSRGEYELTAEFRSIAQKNKVGGSGKFAQRVNNATGVEEFYWYGVLQYNRAPRNSKEHLGESWLVHPLHPISGKNRCILFHSVTYFVGGDLTRTS